MTHFSKHLREPECERWRDTSLPRLDRLVAAAHCRRRAAGHGRFEPDELRLMLGFTAKNRGELTRLIERAVMLGYLEPGSCAACLILANVEGGVGGSPRRQCAVSTQHDRVRETHEKKLRGEQETRKQADARRQRKARAGSPEWLRKVAEAEEERA